LAGDRDRRPAEAGGEAERLDEGVGRARGRRAHRALHDPLPRARAGGLRGRMSFEPLYTAEEMKAAEAGHDVDELMARAGRAVAEEAMRRFPDADRYVAVCGGGANGGDGRIAVEVLHSAGKAARTAEDAPVEEADVVIDALFGTGFHGEP